MPVPPAPGGAPWDAAFAAVAEDGVRLRCALWRGGGRGLALILPGRAEYLEKMTIPAAALVARGFSVASLDWRGQGHSDRLIDPPEKGHVGDFADYRRDVSALLAAPEVAALGPARLVVSHSMGGAIAIEALAAGRLPAVPQVLSAPMLGIAISPPLRAASAVVLWVARRLDRLEGWPPFGDPARPYVLTADFENNMLTGDREVYAWLRAAVRADPRLGLGMPSLGWIATAEAAMARVRAMPRLEVPAICLIGTAERVVNPRAVRQGASRLGADPVEIADARHEVLVEAAGPRAAVWAAIDAFLGRIGV